MELYCIICWKVWYHTLLWSLFPYVTLYHFFGRTPSPKLFEWPLRALYDNILSFEVSTIREEIFAVINFCKFFFRILGGNKFLLFWISQGYLGINFCSHDIFKDFAGIKFRSCLKEQFFPRPYVDINTSLLERNSQLSQEDVIQKTLYQAETQDFVVHLIRNRTEWSL